MKSNKFTLDPLIDVLPGALFDTKQLDNRMGMKRLNWPGTNRLSTNRPWVRNDWSLYSGKNHFRIEIFLYYYCKLSSNLGLKGFKLV